VFLCVNSNDKSCLGSWLFFYLILENYFIQDKFCLTVIISFPLIVESLLQLSLNRRMIKKSFFTTRYYNNYSTVITTTITEEWLSASADITILRVLCFYLKTCINKQWINQPLNSSVINATKSVNLKQVC
jgi:hypothetical protein